MAFEHFISHCGLVEAHPARGKETVSLGFIFQLPKTTMSNVLETSFNRVIKDCPDRCHVWDTSTGSPSNLRQIKRAYSQLQGTYMHVLFQNTCRIYVSNKIVLKGIHFAVSYSTQEGNANIAT